MRGRMAVAMSVALAACGGGSGGSGGGGGVPVTSGPSPAPTGTPTPTPSPSATATPYPTYAQLTGDQSFRTGCASLRYDVSPPLAQPVTPYGSGLTLAYATGTQTWTVTPDSLTSGAFGTGARTYGPAERDASVTGTVTSYARTTNGFQERLSIGSNLSAGVQPDYVRGFSLRVPLSGYGGTNPPAVQYQCVFGVPTRLDDAPRGGGTVTFTRTGLNGTAIVYPASGAPESYSVVRSQISFSIDLTTYRVTTTLRVIGNLLTASGTSTTDVDLGTYSGSVILDETGYFNGSLTSTDCSLRSASFGGWFFGPQGAEAAYAAGITSLDTGTGRQLSLIANAIALR